MRLQCVHHSGVRHSAGACRFEPGQHMSALCAARTRWARLHASCLALPGALVPLQPMSGPQPSWWDAAPAGLHLCSLDWWTARLRGELRAHGMIRTLLWSSRMCVAEGSMISMFPATNRDVRVCSCLRPLPCSPEEARSQYHPPPPWPISWGALGAIWRLLGLINGLRAVR